MKKKHGFLYYLFVCPLIVLISILVCLSLFKIIDCATNPTNHDFDFNPITRTARVNDITIKDDISISEFGCKYTVTPHKNISKLEVKIRIYNEQKTLTSTKTFEVGDLNIGKKYSFVFRLNDLNITASELLSWLTDDFYWDYEVTGGIAAFF